MLTILLFLLVLAVLILVHELGHFGAAKLFGVKVEEFGLGFPPRAWGKKMGETLYSVNWIPLGGFVKIFGEEGESEDTAESSRSLAHKPRWMQAIILLAGISMNILFGYILISIGFMIGLPAPVGSSAYGQTAHETLVITNVLSNSPAKKVGLSAGDVIVGAAAGKNVLQEINADSVSELIQKSQSPITLTYKREDTVLQTANIMPSKDLMAGQQIIGVTMDDVGILKLPVGAAFLQGARTTLELLRGIVTGLWDFIRTLVIGHSDFSEVTGPIGIAHIVGEANSIGFVYLLSLIALISLNLAVINLIPIPALDGGRLLFVIIESITRKKISPKVIQTATGVSFALLLILMLVVSIHDVFSLI